MRIHWFSPLPPARTDIAQYTVRILPALRARAEVTLWTSQSEWPAELQEYAAIRRFDPGDFPGLPEGDTAFFNIGNSSMFHRDIWQVCREHPGIAVLHDVLLHDAVVNHCRIAPELEGAYPDGWTSERLSVAFGPGRRGRKLTLRLRTPEWKGGELSVRTYALPAEAGRIEMEFPGERVDGPMDGRVLGVRLEAAGIAGPGGRVLLGGREMYFEIMESLYGPCGRRDAELHWRGGLSLDQMAAVYSCIPFMLPAGRGVVVHSRMAERAVRQESRLPIARLALPAPAPASSPAPHDGPPPWRLVVFGHLGPNRGVDSILEALQLLEERACFRLHIYGALYDPGLVQQQIEQLGLRELATIHGMVSDAELEAALASAHLAINLRYPTRGEASGSQLRIWRHGLPGIVTKIGWYAEQPESTVAFVRPDHMAEDLAALLRSYHAAPGPFIEMGLNGYRLLAECHTPERYVEGLLNLAARAGAGR
jgi:glycosyltransferase involved in cell wall biosynthesis